MDLSVHGERHQPAALFQGVTNDARWPSIPASGSGDSFMLFGGAAGAASVNIVDSTELANFEGELTVLRMMGHLRVYGVVTQEAQVDDNNRRIEVRAWIYKTWEQQVDNKTGLVHPFNIEDFEARIVWSATWGFALAVQSEFLGGNIDNWAASRAEHWGNHELVPPGPATAAALEGNHIWQGSYGQHVRSIRLRRAIALKGNERLALAIAAGPFSAAGNAGMLMLVGGYIRGLIRH